MFVISRNNIVNNGLALYFDAGIKGSYPGSGTTWVDLANSNNGTLVNSPTYSVADGGSINLDGTNDYVDCGNNASIDLTSSMTMEAWINPDTYGTDIAGLTYGRIFSKYNGSYQYDMHLHGGTNRNFLSVLFGGVQVNSTVDSISLNVWQHVVASYNDPANVVNFYIDGTLDSSLSMVATGSPLATPLIIGNINTGGLSRYFDGDIAIARIYNRALSQDEVTQNFEVERKRFGV